MHTFSLLKKSIAIFLLAIYLFNLAGYSLIFHYFISQSEQKFAQQLDEHRYKDTDLVEISIPFNLPYTQNSSSYEPLEGTVEMNGVVYNYVKRRIYRDTLYIMCLPNQQKLQLTKAKSSYAGMVNDFSANKKEKAPATKKAGFSADYHNNIRLYVVRLLMSSILRKNSFQVPRLLMASIDPQGHPPQTFA